MKNIGGNKDMKKALHIINVQNIAISVITKPDDDFICITDIAKAKG